MLPVVVAEVGTALYEAAPLLRAAAERVILPQSSAGAAIIRASLVARLRAMYGAMPPLVKGIVASTLVGLGVEGVTSEITAFTHAEKDDSTLAMIIYNLAQQGVNPDMVAPPEYVRKLTSTDKAMFDNARAAYASFVAGRGAVPLQVSQGAALDNTSVNISVVENVRTIAGVFGLRDIMAVLELQTAMKTFLVATPASLAIAGATITASGGRL